MLQHLVEHDRRRCLKPQRRKVERILSDVTGRVKDVLRAQNLPEVRSRARHPDAGCSRRRRMDSKRVSCGSVAPTVPTTDWCSLVLVARKNWRDLLHRGNCMGALTSRELCTRYAHPNMRLKYILIICVFLTRTFLVRLAAASPLRTIVYPGSESHTAECGCGNQSPRHGC